MMVQDKMPGQTTMTFAAAAATAAQLRSLACDWAAKALSFAQKLRVYAYLGWLYTQYCMLDAMEKTSAAAAATQTTVAAIAAKITAPDPVRIVRATVLFDFDEAAAFKEGAPPPVCSFDVTQHLAVAARTMPPEDVLADPFSALQAWPDLVRASTPVDFSPERRVRLEVRYTLGRKKYRRVLFHGDEVASASAATARALLPCRANIIRARLCGPGPDPDIDITERLRRYLGPLGDWHGTKRLLARDVFPQDRHETNALAFDHIAIVDGLATHHSVSYPRGVLPDLTDL